MTISAPRPVPVRDSRASTTRLMVPTDANLLGTVFGGQILSEIDRVAFIAATRHARAPCVTASFDRVDFIHPVHVGEVVDCEAILTFVGRSSMEIWVTVRAEAPAAGMSRVVGEAFVTMVAIDPAGRPVPVPPLEPRTEDDRRRFEEGRLRTEERRRTRRAGHG